MSYMATLVPYYYFPANYAVSSVAASVNAELASAAVSQAVSTSVATQTAVSTAASTTASSTTAATATASTAVSSGTSATVAAISSVAVPIAVSIIAILAAGMVIDIAKAQRELRRCNKLSLETVFCSRDQLVDALFSHGGDGCQIFEEADGTLIVRYQLEDYFFRMNPQRGCYDLEIINAQHPSFELEKINQIQLHYMEAVRQNSYRSLMETVAEQGWTVERSERAQDGSIYVSILV